MSDSLRAAIESTCKSLFSDWKKAKKRAGADDRLRQKDLRRFRRLPSYRVSVREVAFEVMEAAYLKASGNGRYPANARQIYYAARPEILAKADAEEVDSQYFTQTLLKEYLEQWRPDWDVVYDARGHFTEPHTNRVIGLGGLDVRAYVAHFTNGEIEVTPELKIERRIPTKGPSLRYGGVLFIEKEGFDELLEEARIGAHFDVAIASTKGLPVAAFCDLAHILGRQGHKVLVVHDFDPSGFSIVGTLRRGARGSRGRAPTGQVVDLGLRLEDIAGLQREPFYYRQHKKDPAVNLRRNGATEAEIAILVQAGDYRCWQGERVELNAMTSDQIVEWLERKLEAAGVKKVIPEEKVLGQAFVRAWGLQILKKQAEKLRKRVSKEKAEIPPDLQANVRQLLSERPELSWDEAIWQIAEKIGGA